MHTIKTYDSAGAVQLETTVAAGLLETERGDQAVHDVIVAQQAARRGATSSTKSKGEVNGSGRKPWRQKGTGRARAGYRQSPVWRGGGVAFGPKPRLFEKKVNRKVSGLAFRRAFTLRLAENAVSVIEAFAPESPKTRWLAALLKQLGIDRSCLILTAADDPVLLRVSRNLPWVALETADRVDVESLMRYRTILLDQAAFEAIQKRLAGATQMETEA